MPIKSVEDAFQELSTRIHNTCMEFACEYFRILMPLGRLKSASLICAALSEMMVIQCASASKTKEQLTGIYTALSYSFKKSIEEEMAKYKEEKEDAN